VEQSLKPSCGVIASAGALAVMPFVIVGVCLRTLGVYFSIPFVGYQFLSRLIDLLSPLAAVGFAPTVLDAAHGTWWSVSGPWLLFTVPNFLTWFAILWVIRCGAVLWARKRAAL